MRLSYIFLVGVALITLPFVAIKAQYDDDTTPRKVRLEDLEEEQDKQQQQHERLQQFTQQQLPLPANHKPNQQRLGPLPPRRPTYYESEAGIKETVQQQKQTLEPPAPPPPLKAHPLKQHVTPPLPARPTTDSDYETASENRYSLDLRPFIGASNGIAGDAGAEDIDDLRRDPPPSHDDGTTYSHNAPQQWLHRQQLSGGYALKHEPAAFVLVPPFSDAVADGNSAALHNHRLEASSSAAPPPPFYHLRRPLPPPPNKPFGAYLPSEPAPLPSLQYAGAAGVQYVNNNNLGDEGDSENDNEDAPPTASGAIAYAREHFPQLEYGSPNVHFRRPNFPQSPPALLPPPLQSNQVAYAPQRAEAATLASGAVKIPYPPSFISITTRRPQYYKAPAAGVRPLGGRAFYGGDFKASQPDPIPDFFSHRQPKSLLDSYIPSWLVAKMLQQPRQVPGFNTLAYTGATPLNRHYKRELLQNNAKKDNFGQKIVKKSLDTQSEKEEMLMTA